ncbi:MAG: hypothetical protein INR69_04105 [Mucilaginibacter polytrichastri]|nr:hypothetical protein [Mucilaginibacter polytrichastri]
MRKPGIAIFVLWLLSAGFFRAHAQDRQAQGVVYDKDTRNRIARIQIVNLRTRASIFNNLKGEFSIAAREGDKLSFSTSYYRSDTITYSGEKVLLVYLKRISIPLPVVTVYDSINNPRLRLEATKREYSKVYGAISNRNMINIPNAGSGAAGLSIDALYNSISRSGRNAKKLQEIIERDYREQMVDYRFNKTMVGSATGLTGDKLGDFIQKYRPSYTFVMRANEYEMLNYVLSSYRRYLRNPDAYALPPLIEPATPEKEE